MVHEIHQINVRYFIPEYTYAFKDSHSAVKRTRGQTKKDSTGQLEIIGTSIKIILEIA